MAINKLVAQNDNMLKYVLGSDIHPNYSLFDETRQYNEGDIVLWKGYLYIVKSGQTSIPNQKGVFTHNPESDTTIWEPYEAPFNSCYAYNAAGNTEITNTDTVVALDTIEYNNNIASSISNGALYINSDKVCIISFSVSYDNTSGTNRTSVKSWLEGYDGSNWIKINGTEVYTYHRQYNKGEDTASCTIVLDCSNYQAFRIVANKYSGTDTIQTAINGNVITIVEIVGARGAMGPPGPPGSPGDIVWMGPWQNQNYLKNQAVEYQGSSYVCTQNTTSNQPPTDPNFWDLMAQKGQDGSGSSINIQDDNIDIPNTPHTTLNFGEWLEAVDSGGGKATINLVSKPFIQYGASGDQTLTSNSTWTALKLDTDIIIDNNFIQRSGSRLYAQKDLKLKISYSVFLYLDSGDSARNTMRCAIRKNGSSILPYTQSGCYTRGWNYSRHANCAIAPTYIELQNGDYIELVFMASEDYQSPHIGNNQSWISLEVL